MFAIGCRSPSTAPSNADMTMALWNGLPDRSRFGGSVSGRRPFPVHRAREIPVWHVR